MFSSKWPKIPTFFSQNSRKMDKKNSKNKQNQKEMTIKSQTRIEGTMTFIETDNKMHLLDFTNDEDAMMTPATFDGKVQVMRDGNVYISEKKKRKYNKPIFREDHSSLSLGFNGVYYFTFRLPAELVDELPEKLAHEALTIAQKVVNEILYTKAEEV